MKETFSAVVIRRMFNSDAEFKNWVNKYDSFRHQLVPKVMEHPSNLELEIAQLVKSGTRPAHVAKKLGVRHYVVTNAVTHVARWEYFGNK